MKKIISLLIVITIFSCEENNSVIENPDNLLIGNWSNAVYDDEKTTFSRVNDLPRENYGVTFKTDETYIERTSGWCGTPPLTFFNIDGNYQLKDSLITVTKNSYPNIFAWRIVSLSESTLVVKRELTDQEIEHRKLMDTFNEISTLAYSLPCNDAANWTFVGYGTKACGGFQGYIAYSKNIDTVSFLNKVENYNKAENEYNIKFNIISDCSLAPKSTAVICKNGYPTLKY
ncbi:hypothetical protein [Polaribacter aestuariivivens]|uniref:hypothetical protein n=1 Tax=Polaribacter aestuariivivens TaxID=2304626 RepID=UPI003F492C49